MASASAPPPPLSSTVPSVSTTLLSPPPPLRFAKCQALDFILQGKKVSNMDLSSSSLQTEMQVRSQTLVTITESTLLEKFRDLEFGRK